MRDKVSISVSYVLTAILALAFVALLITYIAVPNVMYLLLLILDFIFLRKLVSMIVKKNPTALLKSSVSFLIVFVLSTLFWGQVHMPIRVISRWQYPMALKYAYGFHAVSTFFPEELPTSAKDVRYDFFPSILQADGHVCVEFTADEDYVKELSNRLEKEAMYVINYRELDSLNATINTEESDYKRITLWEGSFGKEHPDAIVYIIYTNYDWNHARFKAVFIDGNHVFFSEQ
jgi:energy-coupling factor transporter transmembrane protein EcfT